MMAGKNGPKHVAELNTVKVLCWMVDIRNLSVICKDFGE
jgi:hypothetical protein